VNHTVLFRHSLEPNGETREALVACSPSHSTVLLRKSRAAHGDECGALVPAPQPPGHSFCVIQPITSAPPTMSATDSQSRQPLPPRQ